MKNAIQISVAKPCSEKFDDFSPTATGGYCGSCQKEVIDFTTMTSKELFLNLSNAKDKTCGRFASSQLTNYNNTMNTKTSFVSRGIAVLSFSLLSLCAVSNLNAQDVAIANQPLTPEITVIEHSIVMGEIAILQEEYTVTGTVLDEENLPLAGVNVVLKGSTEGVSTDFDGTFEFPRKLNVNDVLVFSYIGYDSKEYMVTASTSDNINITINFDVYDVELMGEVVVGGAHATKRNVFQKFIALFK